MEQLLLVPWGHHRIIIDKCKTLEKCLFYIRTAIKNNLSRYDLESRILAGGKRSVLDIKTIYKTMIIEKESIDYINTIDILPNAIKKRVCYVRKIFTFETKRNYDYGSWSEFIEAEEIKNFDTILYQS